MGSCRRSSYHAPIGLLEIYLHRLPLPPINSLISQFISSFSNLLSNHFFFVFNSHADEYKCDIKPRSERLAALVRAVDEEHPYEKSDAEVVASLKWE